MEITGRALAGLYAIVALALASSASADAAGPTAVVGEPIKCKEKQKLTSSVSKPNTTVKVTCPAESTLEPKVAGGSNNIYTNEQCSTEGVLSTVCPGATVAPATRTEGGGTTVDVFFPQLPTSQQVVYLKCAKETKLDCIAMITVAPAPPQGPQACAVPGTSVTLHVNQAEGSAQFACGGNLALAPTDRTKAYAEDCTKVETLKDMTRSDVPGGYSTLKVDKLKKKRLCYLCMQGANSATRTEEGDRCTVYIEVSGTTRLASSVLFGFTLPCLAAMLGFI